MPDSVDLNEAEVEPGPRRAMSVRGHLGIFTAVLAAPILLFVGFLLWQIAASERTRLEDEAFATSRNVAVALDRDITGLLASLDVLALSAHLQSGNLQAFYEQAKQLSDRQGIMPVLSDLAGQQLVNVRVPWGTPLPKSSLPVDQAAVAEGRAFVTDVFPGQVSGQPVFAVATAVRRNGQPAYLLNFSLGLDRLQRIVGQVETLPGYTVAIVDRKGTIMARNLRPEEFVGKPASQDLRERTTGPQGNWSGTTADGQQVFGAYMRSNLTGFRAAVGVRYSELNEPLWRSLSLFAAIGIVILGLSILLGFLFGQRITAPIQALAARAAALGRGEPVPPLETSLREANQVGAELAHASTSLREREAELRDANDEIQRFAYIVSHDLRSPLVNIMGFTTELEALRQDTFTRLEALRDVNPDPAERKADKQLGEDFDEAIRFIKASIGKMDRLINAILKLSREGRREFRPERVDMTALIETIKASSTVQAEAANAEISTSRLPAIASDRLAVEQIFSNLVENAVKYLRPGVPGRIEISGRVAGPNVVYEVRDNGRGIDPKDRERVFELFRRAGTQDKPGEGIGLAHVRALVRRLGGSISLTSEPGQGSTFSVVLPKRWSAETQRKAA
jgi:signal transduction histidine kinase